jgi:hypothetical protein
VQEVQLQTVTIEQPFQSLPLTTQPEKQVFFICCIEAVCLAKYSLFIIYSNIYLAITSFLGGLTRCRWRCCATVQSAGKFRKGRMEWGIEKRTLSMASKAA